MTDNLKLINKTPQDSSLVEKIVRNCTDIRPAEMGREAFVGTDAEAICSAGTNSPENAWLAVKEVSSVKK